MSTTAPRPPRVTNRLGLPIPGDESTADYVEYTGAICDQLDAVTASTEDLTPLHVPVVSPAELSSPPYDAPEDGQTVDVLADVAVGAIWRLRWRAGLGDAFGWSFVGGTPLEAVEEASSQLATLNAWIGGFAPTITVPRPGIYRVEQRVSAQLQSGTTWQSFFLSADRASVPNSHTLWAAHTGAQQVLHGTNAQWGNLTGWGRTVALSAGEVIRTMINVQNAAMIMWHRGMRVWPVRIA